jgi:hypothetical protein
MVLFACGSACPAGLVGSSARSTVVRPRIGVPALFSMPERPACGSDMEGALVVGAVDEVSLAEVSGLASSLTTPDLVWLMADGDSGVVWAVDAQSGVPRVKVRLPGDVTDTEDLALGPCPDLSGPCVFIADTGDNDHERRSVSVIAFPEPTLTGAATAGLATVTLDAVWTIRLAFPDDESVDVEAMVVLPDATAILLIEKTTDAAAARIFAARSPWTIQTPQDDDDDNDQPRLLERTGTVTLTDNLLLADADAEDDVTAKAARKARRITGADVHWSGQRLLLRTTTTILEFVDDDGRGFFDLAGRKPRQIVPAPVDEAQGEAIGYSSDGRRWLSISEIKKSNADDGDRPVLRQFTCRSAAP